MDSTPNQFDPYNNPRGQQVYAMNSRPRKIDLLGDEYGYRATPEASSHNQQVDSYNPPSIRCDTRFLNSPLHNRGSTSLSVGSHQSSPQPRVTKTVTTTVTEQITATNVSELNDLEKSLMEKEAALKRELAYLNQYSNPWSRPKQVREPRKEPPARPSPTRRNDSKWVKQCPPTSNPSSRPTSRASDIEADLMEKAAKLLQDVEELEKIPLNKQQILIEVGSKRPLEGATSGASESGVSSVHTAIIKVPTRQVDNKSPLPFAYDNFSTLGVRGNIASVGAAPPEKPYAPIFPTIKRTPSPTYRYRKS